LALVTLTFAVLLVPLDMVIETCVMAFI